MLMSLERRVCKTLRDGLGLGQTIRNSGVM